MQVRIAGIATHSEQGLFDEMIKVDWEREGLTMDQRTVSNKQNQTLLGLCLKRTLAQLRGGMSPKLKKPL